MGKRKYAIEVGDIFFSKEGGVPCTVVDATHTERVNIRWLDVQGHEMVVQAAHLRTGRIKNPYNPTVHGLGYFGVGSFKAYEDGKNTKTYKIWWHMLERCYLASSKSYKGYGAKGVKVCDEWHNYQTFAKWLVQQKGWGLESYEIDKDVVGNGMEYSPDMCAYIPRSINAAMRSDYDNKIANVYKTKRGWWVQAYRFGKKIRVGTFKHLEEAEQVSIDTKRAYILELAEIYAKDLEPRVYEAMLNWKPLRG